jgi:hypothetical protein
MDRLFARTTGIGIVLGLSAVMGAILGAILAVADGDPGLILGGAFLALVVGLVYLTPLRAIPMGITKIHPILIIPVAPFIIIFLVTVWPASKLALAMGWIQELDDDE